MATSYSRLATPSFGTHFEYAGCHLSSAPARVVVPRASVKSSSTRDVRIRAHREDKSRRALIASTAALVATGSLSRVARAQEYVDGPDGIQYADLKVEAAPSRSRATS